MKNYIYRVRYANGNENSYGTFSLALNEYKLMKDSVVYKAVELYRLDCVQGLVKTLRGEAYN